MLKLHEEGLLIVDRCTIFEKEKKNLRYKQTHDKTRKMSAVMTRLQTVAAGGTIERANTGRQSDIGDDCDGLMRARAQAWARGGRSWR